MNRLSEPAPGVGKASANARRLMIRKGGSPLFIADWSRALFVHYEVKPSVLQPFVPFPLDLRGAKAYVTFVAFSMVGMRPAMLPERVGRCLMGPMADCRFLNLRTYVAHHGEPGIYFLAEWLSSRCSVPLGPLLFGLPYRAGKIDFRHAPANDRIEGCVAARGGKRRFAYSARLDPGAEFAPCAEGSLPEFLLERYVAFTERNGCRRRFRVFHEPWLQLPVDPLIEEDDLLADTGSWSSQARRIGAHFSPGVFNVWMGKPNLLRNFGTDRLFATKENFPGL